ncbi:TetR/AcrR family transcriptional regulator [Macrococcus capreoli]|uniref:TetR/AcrR family transcriptional regulator n=1 Tax=Macrococcus capreoli TaxID=2982690 RepID=UPI003EE6FA2D
MGERDLRVIKTELALEQAFLELSKHTTFDKISVQELCDKAMVRRSTFYRHYEDKFDFMRCLICRMFQSFNAHHQDKYDELQPTLFYTAVINDMMDFLLEHKNLSRTVMMSEYHELITQMLYEQIYDTIYAHLVKQQVYPKKLYTEEKRLAEFLSGGILRVLYNWLRSGQQESKDSLCTSINNMINQFIHY